MYNLNICKKNRITLTYFLGKLLFVIRVILNNRPTKEEKNSKVQIQNDERRRVKFFKTLKIFMCPSFATQQTST